MGGPSRPLPPADATRQGCDLPHQGELIATIAAGLTAAFIFGLIAHRLSLPLIVGYLIAGIVIGPFTPGFVADVQLAPQLAEIGVILLMFGVGIHFSVSDLLAIRRIALPGALIQVTVSTALGIALTRWWGWDFGAGLVMGLALSIASTVVLLRTLENRGIISAPEGKLAVGWLLVEDLIAVVALVLLPALAGPLGGTSGSDGSVAMQLIVTVGKVALFMALMLVVGTRLVPWLLRRVVATGSRELFILATLAIAIGVAYIALELFGVSLALAAFLAGMVVNESPLSHRAAEEALPLREAFAVLFFVSVGMLIDPRFLLDEAVQLLAVLAVIYVGTGLVSLAVVRLLGGTMSAALIATVGLAQIGEFSFILAEMGRGLDILPEEGQKLILAAALISITINPLLFAAVEPTLTWLSRRAAPAPILD